MADTLIGLTLALAVAGTVTGFTLARGSAPERDPAGQVEDHSGDQPPVRSDEGIDPNECNWAHNNTACDGSPTLEDPPLPRYEDWLSDHDTDGESGPLTSIRSDEGFGPNECNLVHNINACDEDKLSSGGVGISPPPTSSEEKPS